MATLSDIGVSALINILTAFAFLLAFAVLRIQPVNDSVYLPKWYINGGRSSPRSGGNFVAKFLNLDFKTYLSSLNWMPQALKMSESELINHAALDSAEYDNVATMRLRFLASQRRRAEQFTVVVRNVPQISGNSISDSLDQFFKTSHPDTYLCHQLQNWLDYNQLKLERHSEKRPTKKVFMDLVNAFNFQTGFLGLWGAQYMVEPVFLLHYSGPLDGSNILFISLSLIVSDGTRAPESSQGHEIYPASCFCAQTQQSKNPKLWLANWAPEPRDIYWQNLAIPFLSLTIRKLIISLSVFALVFFYMIPIAFVQSLAKLEGLERVAPFLRSVIELKFIKSFLQGFLRGLALKIFLYILPTILMIMSKIEGHIALSTLERRASAKYYYFMLVNVFLGSIVTGTAFEQLHSFLHQSPTQIPRTIGVSIPMKATFFITFMMVDGWAGIAGEILRLKPLVIFHLKNMFLLKTERDREQAMDPGSVDYPETLPITVIRLVLRNAAEFYESGAAFWPHVHSHIIASLVISQLLLLGLLSTKEAANSTPLLAILPILTSSFNQYCKHRFEPAFRRYPLEKAMKKDIMDQTTEPDINLTTFLADAYLHPIFRSFEEEELVEVRVDKVRVDKNQSFGDNAQSQTSDGHSSPSPPHHPTTSPPQDVYHHGFPPQYAYNFSSPTHYGYHYEAEPGNSRD
ncbi:hypothetical protein Gotur_032948 [Gossypium turneri]